MGSFSRRAQLHEWVSNKVKGIHNCIYLPMALQPFLGPWPLLTPSVGLLGRGISPSEGRFLHTGQHKHRINAVVHTSSGIRTHDPNVGASEDISCLRLRGHCDRQYKIQNCIIYSFYQMLLGRTIEKDVMGGTWSTHGKWQVHIDILVRNPEGKRPIGRTRHRWEEMLKHGILNYGNVVWKCRLNLYGSG
jgi:hypothetical protein